MTVQGHIFRAYDIRGIYGTDLTEEVAMRIGQAFGTYLGGAGKDLAVGRDVRLSGQTLQNALIQGLRYTGCNVQDIGVAPTPVLYFSIVHHEKDGGVMVTASHNPAEWNGFKLCRERGLICAQNMGMDEIKEMAMNKRFELGTFGRLSKNDAVLTDYTNFVLRRLKIERHLLVALDISNGACASIAPRLFKEAYIEAIAINTEPDGNFPAHNPEPTQETLQELIERVVRDKADFGVGYDGDGDRALFVDDKGRVVPGDIALIILAKPYLKEKRGAKVVYEVSCSSIVERMIKAYGGVPVLSRVGHAYIQERMIREEAVIGGEVSSHLYFSDLYGIDDAVYASLKMAELLSKTNEKLSELVDSIPRYPSIPLKVFDCPDEKKFKVVEKLTRELGRMGFEVNTIDGVKVIEPDGWFLVRASNTLPQIKMTAEAKTHEKLEELASFAERRILEIIQEPLETDV